MAKLLHRKREQICFGLSTPTQKSSPTTVKSQERSENQTLHCNFETAMVNDANYRLEVRHIQMKGALWEIQTSSSRCSLTGIHTQPITQVSIRQHLELQDHPHFLARFE